VGDSGLCSTWTDTTSAATTSAAGAAWAYRRQDHIDIPAVVAVPRVGTVRGVDRRRWCRTTAADFTLGAHGCVPGTAAVRRRRCGRINGEGDRCQCQSQNKVALASTHGRFPLPELVARRRKSPDRAPSPLLTKRNSIRSGTVDYSQISRSRSVVIGRFGFVNLGRLVRPSLFGFRTSITDRTACRGVTFASLRICIGGRICRIKTGQNPPRRPSLKKGISNSSAAGMAPYSRARRPAMGSPSSRRSRRGARRPCARTARRSRRRSRPARRHSRPCGCTTSGGCCSTSGPACTSSTRASSTPISTSTPRTRSPCSARPASRQFSRISKASLMIGRRTRTRSSSSSASTSAPASSSTASPYVTADEIKKALRLKAAFSTMLDQMQ
jgi:hypothetical protein